MDDTRSQKVTKSYTRAGDSGNTALFGGDRVSKSHLRVATYGTLDELNAWIGYIRSQHSLDKDIDTALDKIQNNLLTIGSILANPKHATSPRPIHFDAQKEVDELEKAIDPVNERLPQLTQFILPGGTKTAALLHVGRTITRRAERLVVALAEQEPDTVDTGIIGYLNRVSSALFVFARSVNFKSGVKEPTW